MNQPMEVSTTLPVDTPLRDVGATVHRIETLGFDAVHVHPAGRLGGYLGSLRAIFAVLSDGGPLHHEGPHYRFDRLQPYFNPGPIDVPPPQLWTGGVNPEVCRMAGQLADGFVTHATNSRPRFLRQRLFPALAEGAAAAGRATPS